jgi:hypothetical protein
VANKYSTENEKLAEKVGEYRFTYVTRWKDEYSDTIERINSDNTKLKTCISHCWEKIDSILQIDDNEAVVERALNKLASSLIKIDKKKPEFGDIILSDEV